MGICVVCVCVVGVCVVFFASIHAALSSPENHHVQGIVGDGGNQSCQGDDKDGRNEEVWAAVWTWTRASLALAPAYTHALSV